MISDFLEHGLFHYGRGAQFFEGLVKQSVLLGQLLQMLLVWHDQRDRELLGGITINANVLNNSTSFQFRFNLSKRDVFAGLQLNQILLTILG